MAAAAENDSLWMSEAAIARAQLDEFSQQMQDLERTKEQVIERQKKMDEDRKTELKRRRDVLRNRKEVRESQPRAGSF